MIPSRIRDGLFNRLSAKTMRYVEEVPISEATGLTEQVYEMVAEEFFINGSITSHSAVPELMAGMWCGGRESMLVEDQLDRATKEAVANVLSRINGCPYCEDMTVSLVHGTGSRELAGRVTEGPTVAETEPEQEALLRWAEAVANGKWDTPFPLEADAFPEAVGTVTAFSYIPRFSHVTMAGSPIEEPLGVRGLNRSVARFFGRELGLSLSDEFEPGRSLELLPAPESSYDVAWASYNPRLEHAYSRWISTVDRHTEQAIPTPVRDRVETRVSEWNGETMPISRSWVDDEVDDLEGSYRDLARFGLLVALSPSQVDDAVVQPVLGDGNQERLVRALAWSAMTGARRVATGIAEANPNMIANTPEDTRTAR